MSVIAHLSDTHFGTEVPKVMRAIEYALLQIKPDIALISGDLTQRARPSQFNATQAFLEKLPAEMKFVVPGNHDIPLFNMPLRLLDPYSNYTHVFGMREGIWCHDNVAIIGFDATSRWRHTRGKLVASHVAARLKQARSQLKPGTILIVCAHQPLAVAWPQDSENVLVNAQQTAKVFSEHSVDIVLSGHVHVPIITTTSVSFPTLQRHFVLSGAGTAISRRIRPNAPNSFNVIKTEIENNIPTIAITLMEYRYETDCFERGEETKFSLESFGWLS